MSVEGLRYDATTHKVYSFSGQTALWSTLVRPPYIYGSRVLAQTIAASYASNDFGTQHVALNFTKFFVTDHLYAFTKSLLQYLAVRFTDPHIAVKFVKGASEA